MFLRAIGNYLGNATTSMIRGVVEPGYFEQQRALRQLGFQDDSPKVFMTPDGEIFEVGVNRDGKRFEAHFDANSRRVTLITITPGHFPLYLGHDGTRKRRMTPQEVSQFTTILQSELSSELGGEVLSRLVVLVASS